MHSILYPVCVHAQEEHLGDMFSCNFPIAGLKGFFYSIHGHGASWVKGLWFSWSSRESMCNWQLFQSWQMHTIKGNYQHAASKSQRCTLMSTLHILHVQGEGTDWITASVFRQRSFWAQVLIKRTYRMHFFSLVSFWLTTGLTQATANAHSTRWATYCNPSRDNVEIRLPKSSKLQAKGRQFSSHLRHKTSKYIYKKNVLLHRFA